MLITALCLITAAAGAAFAQEGNIQVAPFNSVHLEVNNGGSIDARTIPADRVIASVEHGGGIFTVPGASLVAKVIQGGNIMYWGDAQVRSSVQHGGIVIKGKPGELLLPPSEIGFSNFSAKRH